MVLEYAEGLIEIQGQMVNRDFHVGNIIIYKREYLGLCRKIDIDEKNIYGVMPNAAPEENFILKLQIYNDYVCHSNWNSDWKNWQIIYSSLGMATVGHNRLMTVTVAIPTLHAQAIYTFRLLNPFIKNLKHDDNVNNNSVEITDFTKL
ncbi:hypothetical protein RhiirA1_465058 [Rhizophagus irregularis]|uniref:Protein kinase domain-containing protein n=1 Tax=Rhizophagus irregularis TaxID=588596 RepID=A0A2N0RGS9_9GLOM|nr:hypothetical protein RhiirA1_465058 [Rhizophagus irregularis]